MHNIGIIGYGAFGRFLRQSWSELGNARVSFITKTQTETARKMAEEDGVPKYSADHRDLLADPEVEIVAICAPPHLHEQIAVEALKAGKHVLVEKPLAMNPEQAQNIVRAAKESGRVASVNFMMRYSGLMEKLHSLCEEGLLGGLRRVIVENYAGDSGLRPDHWFWDQGKSGGIFVEHGVHFFDIVGWMIGSRSAQVSGLATERAPGIEDKVLAVVEYEDQTMATFYHAFSGYRPLERTTARYVFDRGQVDVEGWIPISLRLRGYVSEEECARLRSLFKGATATATALGEHEIVVSGKSYSVAMDIDLSYTESKDKQAEYARCVQRLMSDMIAAIEDPSHKMRVTLEDGLRSVEIACAAAKTV